MSGGFSIPSLRAKMWFKYTGASDGMATKTSRILFPDKDGNLRQLFSISYDGPSNDKSIMVFLGRHFNEARFFKNDGGVETVLSTVQSAHVSYHSSGSIHMSCYGSSGRKLPESLGRAIPNLPLEELSPGKEFMKIVPFAIERFPLHCKKLRETDVPLHKYTRLPEFMLGGPIEIGFWIGRGEDSGIQDKFQAIWHFEVSRSLRQVEVIPLQAEEVPLQLFLAIRRPKELTEFPDRTSVTIYTADQAGAGYLHRKDENYSAEGGLN